MQAFVLEFLLSNAADRDHALCSSQIAALFARQLRKIRADVRLPYTVRKVERPIIVGG